MCLYDKIRERQDNDDDQFDDDGGGDKDMSESEVWRKIIMHVLLFQVRRAADGLALVDYDIVKVDILSLIESSKTDEMRRQRCNILVPSCSLYLIQC